MRTMICHFVGVLMALWLVTGADAALHFNFAPDRADYQALPGARVMVQLFLEEQAAPPDSSLLVAESGLFSAGLKLGALAPLPTEPASVLSASDIVADPAFTGGSLKSLSPLTLLLNDGILAEPGPAGDLVSDGLRRVRLATLWFTAGKVPGEVTTFKITDFDDFGISSDTLTWQGTELDKSITPGQFAVTIVPAPGAALMFVALGVPALLVRRRSRRSA